VGAQDSRKTDSERSQPDRPGPPVAVHRYRKRYRLLLRAEIARTLDDPAEIEEEITTLIAALAA
jgi:hypothetical protein